jgi:predicted Zn-dependent protease
VSDADALSRLLALRGGARDGALLRISIANALIESGRSSDALVELKQALDFDPHYSAAWKLFGNVLAQTDDNSGAIAAYRAGIAAAVARGDKQSAKEMQVFLRRLERSSDS